MASTFQNGVMYACFAVLALLACVCAFVGFRQVGRWLRARLCPIALVAFASAAIIATCDAQKRGNEAARAPLPRGEYTVSITPRSVGEAALLPLPGAVTNAKWRAHGAFEDAFYIRATNWWARMPDGRWMDRLRILSSGGFRARGVGSGAWTNYPPPFTQKISLAPEANWHLLGDATGGTPVVPVNGQDARSPSLFWHATTPSNTLVVSWIGGLYARSHTNLVDFQAEIFNDGSLDYRYADRTEHFAASLPFDLDGDGLENSVDPDPLTAGPDAHGTNAEWYNTVCSNVLEAVASGGTGTTGILPVDGDSVLSWRADVNSNAYYFVDVVAERGPAPIYFTGDRDSRLGNPVVVALAGVTNRVPLLIGVDYAVTSDTPFTVSFPIDYIHPTVTTNDVADYNVHWPLNFVFTESLTESNRVYTVTVEPYDPGGVLTWEGVGMRSGASSGCGCGCLSCMGFSIGFNCSSICTCHGECKAVGRYAFETALFAVAGGECRCGFDDPPPDSPPSPHEPNDPPSLTITFSKPAVIFEDSFLEKPGVTMPRRSTRVRLTIDAYGGSGGGTFSVTGVKMSKLFAIGGNVVLPYGDELPPGGSYHATGVYEGIEGSDELNDVEVQGILVPNYYPYNTSTSTATLTSVKVALTAEYIARDNPCQTRHTYGVGEKVHLSTIPALESITYRALKADVSDSVTPYDTVRDGDRFGRVSEVDASQERIYICPAVSTTPDITVFFAAVKYRPAMTVVEPSEVVSPAAFWTGDFWPTQVGFGCMSITNYIGPFHVSFKGVMVAEIPCNEAIPPTGFFASTNYTGELTHNYNAGAGRLLNIKQDNYWRQDDAGRDGVVGNWDSGVLTWKVPIGWKRFLYEDQEARGATYECDYEIYTNKMSRPLLIGGRTDAYVQTFRIDSDGTTTIEKFGWRMTRSRWSFSGTVEKTE